MKFIMGESPKNMRAVTSGIVSTARMTANAFGVAILQTTAAIGMYLYSGAQFSKSNVTPDQIVAGFKDAYLVGALLIVISLVLILLIRDKNSKKNST
jgi:hypothetical protein